MLIRSLIQDVEQVGFKDEVYKVVEGIADVSKEAYDHLIQFRRLWQPIVEPVSEDISKKLQPEAKKAEDEVKSLADKTVKELRKIASGLGISYEDKKKEELVQAIEAKQNEK